MLNAGKPACTIKAYKNGQVATPAGSSQCECKTRTKMYGLQIGRWTQMGEKYAKKLYAITANVPRLADTGVGFQENARGFDESQMWKKKKVQDT